MSPEKSPEEKTSFIEGRRVPPDAAGPAEERISQDDQKLFELLDRYVCSLHEGDFNTLSGLMRQHPELEGLMRCLNSLECFAVPADSGNGDFEADAAGIPQSDRETVVLPDDGSQTSGGMEPGDGPVHEFGKYELLGEIGRGGMGVVYRARQKDLDRVVALKMILSSRLASEDDIQRFYAEARAAGSLRHANIVGIHEVGEINGQHYFAMDCVDGESLADLIRNGPVDDESAAKCMADVARAVDFLHKHHIVHRDLKPSNILLDAEGTPYVTDFGLAKIFDADGAMTQTGTIVGTPSYMAPEQAAGRNREISPQSDVYSLGAILYELLTGRPPFKRDSPLDTLVDVLEGEPTLPSKINRAIPRELELVCLQCLEKDPAKRYRSAAELADDLDRYLKREPVSARPSGILQRLRRWSRREPALVTRWTGIFLAAAIVQIKYMIDGVDFEYHMQIMMVFGVWAVVAFVFQRMLHRDSLAPMVRFAWAVGDIALLTTALFISEPPLGSLLIGYPLLVAASGLFFRVRLVIFTTCVAIAAYTVLILLKPDDNPPPVHYPIIFAAVLVVLGFMVGYQVYRVRVLSRYYDHHRLP